MLNFKSILILFLLFNISEIYTNTQIISVGGLAFNPTTANVTVGDTIKWIWVSGFHTTTSTTIPAGASPWNAPIDTTNPGYNYVVTVAGQYNYRCNFHFLSGMTGIINVNPIGIINITGSTPRKFVLFQNYPNPFNPSTNIEFDVAESGFVSLKIFDVTGKEIENLVNENLQRGTYRVDWSGIGLPSGVYIYKLKSGNFTASKKMILLK